MELRLPVDPVIDSQIMSESWRLRDQLASHYRTIGFLHWCNLGDIE